MPGLDVIIPTLDAAAVLGRTLRAIAPFARRTGAGILVVDGGSGDGTPAIAAAAGAVVLAAPPGRGRQLAAGAAASGAEWLLFLHADCRPGPGWAAAIAAHVADPAGPGRAGYFRFALDDPAPAARRLEAIVAWRCRALALPYGDQGLLIHRALYDAAGGFPPIPLMEDVALVRRLGARRLACLPAALVTSAARYRRHGYVARPLRNLACLALYGLGVPPAVLARLYGR